MKRIFALGLSTKRKLALAALGMTAVALAGCPIYGDSACYDSTDCQAGQYCGGDGLCHAPSGDDRNPGGGASSVACRAPTDCGPNETCAADSTCHPGDCSYKGTGCVVGYFCQFSPGIGHACVEQADAFAEDADGTADAGVDASVEGTDADASTDAAADDAADADPSDGAASSDALASDAFCGRPADCADAETCGADGQCHAGDCGAIACINGFVCKAGPSGPSCVHGNPAACGADLECGGDGARCIDGLCAAPSALCSDQTQCAAGNLCVDGKCVARCTTDVQCRGGFACHPTLGACTVAVEGCTATADCASASSVCIDNACVPRCGAGGACQPGSVCVDNGCVPIAAPEVACGVDGQQDTCAAGEICLHHHCYASCEPPNDAACAVQAVFAVCKQVTTASGAHAVCGSAQNLGAECDVTLGRACSPGHVCVDGYCRL